MLLILCFSNGSVLVNSSARKFNANRNNKYWEEYALAKPKTVKDPSILCYTRAVTTLGHETGRTYFISFEFTQGHVPALHFTDESDHRLKGIRQNWTIS